MCFYYDGTCEVYNESIHKARKAHKCCSCCRRIEPGEQYLSVFSVYEGHSDTRPVCNQCAQDAVSIERHEVMSGCFGMEARPPWEDVHSLIRRGNSDEELYSELETDFENDFHDPVLFWPYSVPPACKAVDLKQIPELMRWS